jgi:hypothetical protein
MKTPILLPGSSGIGFQHARNGAARQARRTVARGKARRCAANLGALDRGKKSLLAPPIAG